MVYAFEILSLLRPRDQWSAHLIEMMGFKIAVGFFLFKLNIFFILKKPALQFKNAILPFQAHILFYVLLTSWLLLPTLNTIKHPAQKIILKNTWICLAIQITFAAALGENVTNKRCFEQ